MWEAVGTKRDEEKHFIDVKGQGGVHDRTEEKTQTGDDDVIVVACFGILFPYCHDCIGERS